MSKKFYANKDGQFGTVAFKRGSHLTIMLQGASVIWNGITLSKEDFAQLKRSKVLVPSG